VWVQGVSDEEFLPSAATCVNTLKVSSGAKAMTHSVQSHPTCFLRLKCCVC